MHRVAGAEEGDMSSPTHDRRRLIVVSNRLPFSIRTNEGRLEFAPSAGGLVTGLSSFLNSLQGDASPFSEYLWVGWPGDAVDAASERALEEKALSTYRSVPVHLTSPEMDNFYLGFCNKTLWPLFHSFPMLTAYDEPGWDVYRSINRKFADKLISMLRPDDVVWIHDYHLLLLPALLRERFRSMKIGFFLHIPFPSFEIFQLLPSAWRRDLLNGLLGASLVGFHTYEYTQHFLQSVLRILGYANTFGGILLSSRTAKAATFPMGIDYDKYARTACEPDVIKDVADLKVIFGESRIMLSVDRLDYTKGILNRLQGFDRFLERNPGWRKRIVLALVVVPSRIGVSEYDKMKRQVEEHVGRINGKYGMIGWTPVVYQYRNVGLEPLVALYAASDIALVTPLRDGMNLVAKEYVASRGETGGVLILSEMAGAAKELTEAILVNPNHCGDLATAIEAALALDPDEQAHRMHLMQSRLKRSTVQHWAADFLGDLLDGGPKTHHGAVLPLHGAALRVLRDDYKRARKRLILLDYDGTLVPFAHNPGDARPGPEVIAVLYDLTDDPANTVAIVSGRDREALSRWFDGLRTHLVAEHGFLSRSPGSSEWAVPPNIEDGWKAHLLPILRTFADRLPGTWIEEKTFSLVWHYRSAEPELGEAFARELHDNLTAITGNIDVQVTSISKGIEVRATGANKGTAARELLGREQFDFVFAAGDDTTDEDLFAALPDSSYTVKVGTARTRARFYCANDSELIRLLQVMTGQQQPGGGFLSKFIKLFRRR
jgi:trehalose 6-phosphate synthase/phosphatase